MCDPDANQNPILPIAANLSTYLYYRIASSRVVKRAAVTHPGRVHGRFQIQRERRLISSLEIPSFFTPSGNLVRLFTENRFRTHPKPTRYAYDPSQRYYVTQSDQINSLTPKSPPTNELEYICLRHPATLTDAQQPDQPAEPGPVRNWRAPSRLCKNAKSMV